MFWYLCSLTIILPCTIPVYLIFSQFSIVKSKHPCLGMLCICFGCETRTGIVNHLKYMYRRELIDVAEHRSISTNNQNTHHPRFSSTPKTRTELLERCVFFTVSKNIKYFVRRLAHLLNLPLDAFFLFCFFWQCKTLFYFSLEAPNPELEFQASRFNEVTRIFIFLFMVSLSIRLITSTPSLHAYLRLCIAIHY